MSVNEKQGWILVAAKFEISAKQLFLYFFFFISNSGTTNNKRKVDNL